MLADLLVKHGISIDDLSEDVRTKRVFNYEPETKKIVAQCIASTRNGSLYGWKDKRKKPAYLTDLSDAEFVEVQMKIDFYVPLWLKELESFQSAFIQLNDLGATPKKGEKGREMTPEELAELMRKMAAMDKKSPQKRIG